MQFQSSCNRNSTSNQSLSVPYPFLLVFALCGPTFYCLPHCSGQPLVLSVIVHYLAATGSDPAQISAVIASGADVSVIDAVKFFCIRSCSLTKDGSTPLHHAVMCKKLYAALFLLQQGADPNKINKVWPKPAFLRGSNLSLVKISFMCWQNSPLQFGFTALHYACSGKSYTLSNEFPFKPVLSEVGSYVVFYPNICLFFKLVLYPLFMKPKTLHIKWFALHFNC